MISKENQLYDLRLQIYDHTFLKWNILRSNIVYQRSRIFSAKIAHFQPRSWTFSQRSYTFDQGRILCQYHSIFETGDNRIFQLFRCWGHSMFFISVKKRHQLAQIFLTKTLYEMILLSIFLAITIEPHLKIRVPVLVHAIVLQVCFR